MTLARIFLKGGESAISRMAPTLSSASQMAFCDGTADNAAQAHRIRCGHEGRQHGNQSHTIDALSVRREAVLASVYLDLTGIRPF